MITLEFKDKLVNNRFASNNDYLYAKTRPLNIYYKDNEEEIPYIMIARRPSTLSGVEGGLYHIGGEIYASFYTRQLRGRVLFTNKIKEVLDGARMPLLFKIGNLQYLIGKGFLAEYVNINHINMLFLAVAKRDVKYMDDVKYYVSRDIYLSVYKRIQPVIKDFMALHKGDIVITSNINKFVGSKIPIPPLKTLGEKLKYQRSLRDYCIKEYARTLPKKEIKMLPEDPKKVKKDREAALLSALRAPEVPIPEALEFLERRAEEVRTEVEEGPTIFVPDPLSEEAAMHHRTTITTSAEGLRAIDDAIALAVRTGRIHESMEPVIDDGGYETTARAEGQPY